MVKNAEQAIENYPRSIVKKKVKDVLWAYLMKF
jgi:hypothetical protein